MDLRKKIDEKYKIAIKSRQIDEANTLKLIRSAIKDKDIENRSGDNSKLIDNNKILSLLQNLIKQRKDSIESFKKASRNDLVQTEEKEIEIINQFLPKQLMESEIKEIIEKFISENKIESIKDMGKIMSFLKSNYSGSLDMSLAGKISKNLLGSQ
ncbi:MAG: hypothetical protein CFH19_00650 [Alphaproteobacteria bacterium MarineAlpha5_Bin9]|nr:MAG: hypothetical protein CFH19_00650 [Alphaproteobacteria bacterium MarineAlpha5_Bin9]|tara:strand:+ start:6394 stop:6858 length:465 start_codon:yes stop_codon:yes gene_type:complete